MKQIFRISLILSLLVSLAFTPACAAVSYGGGSQAAPVVVLGAGETIKGLQSVIQGAQGTFAMVSAEGDLILMAWPRGSNYAFTFIAGNGRAQTAIDLNALKMATDGFAQSVKNLEASGWKQVPVSGLPAAVTGAIMAYTLDLVLAGVQTLPSVFILPAIMLPDSNDPIQG